MAVAKQIVLGAGLRYGVAWAVDPADGLPAVGLASATPQQGTLVGGIKSATYPKPSARPVTFDGDDGVLAQDMLPSKEIGQLTFVTSKSNALLDSYLDGTNLVTIGNMTVRGYGTDNQGNEPPVGLMFYRQALDAVPSSATFGQLRQWNFTTINSARIKTEKSDNGEAATDTVYTGYPTRTPATPWGQAFSAAIWGHLTAVGLEGTVNYHPRLNFHRGDGSRTSFALSHPPVSSSELWVWVQDTGIVTPSSVSTDATYPAFTLSSAPATGKKIISLIGTNKPGNS